MYYRAGSEHADITLPGPYTAAHEAMVEYTGSRYQIDMDGNRVYNSGTSNSRPAYIWFGHPTDLGAGFDWPWDTLEVNSAQVQVLP